MPLTETPLHLYLSPHFDDGVFSCGGRIWAQARAGERAVVITVFAGAPRHGTPLSSYAEELHARWGQPAAAVSQRREEDARALAHLGAGAMHWPYLDCIYRRAPEGHVLYAEEAALWGEVDVSDASLMRELARRIMRLPPTSEGGLYAPLAVGRHVDHRIVRQAAEASGRPLQYYEDFPYARDERAVKAALTPSRWEPELFVLSEEALKAKGAAIACYGSQMSSFWAGPKEMREWVRAFAEQTGSGRADERYWRRVQAA